MQGKATTPRTGRLAYTVGWDGTNNLPHAQASTLKKEQRMTQRELTAAATTDAKQANVAGDAQLQHRAQVHVSA